MWSFRAPTQSKCWGHRFLLAPWGTQDSSPGPVALQELGSQLSLQNWQTVRGESWPVVPGSAPWASVLPHTPHRIVLHYVANVPRARRIAQNFLVYHLEHGTL